MKRRISYTDGSLAHVTTIRKIRGLRIPRKKLHVKTPVVAEATWRVSSARSRRCRSRMQQELQGFGWIPPHPVGRRWSHWLAHLLQGLQHPVHHFRRRGPPRARRVRSMLEVVLTRLPRQPERLRLEVYYEDVEPRRFSGLYLLS